MMQKIAIGVLLFVLAALALQAFLYIDDLAGCDTRPDLQKGCEAAGAIVAISGGDTTARTEEAIQLYQNGWAPIIIFSGAAQDKSGPSNARVMRDIAISKGVPRDVIFIDELGRNTKENATKSKSILAQQGVKRAILVTSVYHQRRALLEFENRVDTVTFRGHPVGEDSQWSRLWWLTPTGWWLGLSELVKNGLWHIGVYR